MGADYSGDQERRENARFVVICTGKGQHRGRHLTQLQAAWPRHLVADAFYKLEQELERERFLRLRSEPNDPVPELAMYFARQLTETYVSLEEQLLRDIFNDANPQAEGYGIEFGTWSPMWEMVVSTKILERDRARMAEEEELLRLQYEVGDISKADYIAKRNYLLTGGSSSPRTHSVGNSIRTIHGRRYEVAHQRGTHNIDGAPVAITITCPTCKFTCRTTRPRLQLLASKLWPAGLDRADISTPMILKQLAGQRRPK